MSRSRAWQPGTPGFSLAEVVLAIGLVSFVLLALVGLLSTGLQASKESAEDTALALCAETVQALVQAEGYRAVLANPLYAPDHADLTFFFDPSGVLQTDETGAAIRSANAESRYGCTVTRSPTASGQPHLLMLSLQFAWPLTAPATGRQQRVVVTGLADYE